MIDSLQRDETKLSFEKRSIAFISNPLFCLLY